MSSRITIVGAGPGGLAASIILASAGCQVTVLEARERVGGRSASFEADGFRFDTGPTFFLYPEILESILSMAGRSLHDEIEIVQLQTMYRVLYGDGTALDASSVPERMRAAVAKLSVEDSHEVERFFADNQKKFDQFLPYLQQPFLGYKSLLDARLASLLPTLAPWRQLDRELERYFTDPRVRLAFSFQALYLGMTPQSCPSLFSILPFIEYRYGVFHPIGGCGAIMDMLGRVASEMGVDVRVGEPVRALRFEGRRVVGADTDRGHYAADATVINADFSAAMRSLVPNHLRRRWNDRRIASRRFSCSTFMLYLGLEGDHTGQPHHTVYIPSSYKARLQDLELSRSSPDDPAFYCQNASVTDKSLAPEGHSTLYILMPVPHEPDETLDRDYWAREAPTYRRMVFAQLEKAGFTDLEPRIRFERQITPLDWQQDFRIYRGATFNMAHNFGQMLHQRPRNRHEDLDRVYLVGGGTHPGSGLPTIFESARISSRLLCEDLGITLPQGGPDPAAPPVFKHEVPQAVAR